MTALTTTLITELLNDVGRARVQVTGSSMLPTILPGDVLQVESGPAQVGDIVVFNRDGVLCAHRLLAVVDGAAITRGDSVRRLDFPVPCEDLLGRVVSFDRAGKRIQDLALRRWSSFFLRNSSLLRRAFLRILAARRRFAPPQAVELKSNPSKLQA